MLNCIVSRGGRVSDVKWFHCLMLNGMWGRGVRRKMILFHVGEVCLTLNGIVSCGGGVSDVKWHYFMWGRGVIK